MNESVLEDLVLFDENETKYLTASLVNINPKSKVKKNKGEKGEKGLEEIEVVEDDHKCPCGSKKK